jgi:thiol:disulfide interchange protein DsbD
VTCLATVLGALLPTPARAANTRVRLLFSADAARPGDTIWAGLQMDMAPSWHTYWRNGGDAGAPTTIEWSLPRGVSAGDIQWPVPAKRVDQFGDTALVTYIYSNQTVLLTPLTLGRDLRPGPLTLKATAHWMECSEQCVMAQAAVLATLNIGEETKQSSNAAFLDQWRRKVPARAGAGAATAFWESTRIQTNGRPVIIEWHANLPDADFFPYAHTNFDVSGTTETLGGGDGARLRKIVKTNDGGWPSRLDGILVDGAGTVGVEVDLEIQPPRKAAAPGSLAPMLLLAFLGGLILNVMPCVLPVIALKVLGFVKESAETPARVRKLGLVYGLGVMASFLILAGLAISVREAGGVANWGDAFRYPQVQVALTVLMTLIALNLFGVFEITLSARAAGAASELASRPGYPGAFFNGVVATVLATPCTAPFLGVALAFAFTQPAPMIGLVFAAAGAGFAFPFVVLCAQPGWLKLLPRPGEWMEKFKIAMGFPMLGAAVWLMWLSASGQEGVLWLGLFLVVLALAAWIWGDFVQRGRRRKALAALICLALVAVDFLVLLQSRPDKDAIVWNVWSPEAVAAAQREGHPVLVDFTAKSCLTCQVNKITSLEIGATRAKLRQIGAVALMGDFTRQDPAIAAELERFHRAGVPLVLVYSKDAAKPPEVLPVILTPSLVLHALEEAAR